MLSSGEVPNMYSRDDLDAINNAIKPIMAKKGIPVTKNRYIVMLLIITTVFMHIICREYDSIYILCWASVQLVRRSDDISVCIHHW